MKAGSKSSSAKCDLFQSFGIASISNRPPIQVDFTNRFEKDIRRLAKRYRKIKHDIQLLIQQLEAEELPGGQIPNIEQIVLISTMGTYTYKLS
ncbi:MAG: hypothetical protein AAF609_26205 [Cyanobacteria bacterium P01_C01_bin.120]